MDYKFRCGCPFTSAIDILGDKWMLVIVKQMLIEGKETFKDFTESAEAIATNRFSVRRNQQAKFENLKQAAGAGAYNDDIRGDHVLTPNRSGAHCRSIGRSLQIALLVRDWPARLC